MLKCALLFCLVSFVLAQAPVKRLAGPPEEFDLHRIPDPATVITKERSASLYIWFDSSLKNGLVYSTTIPVDGLKEFVFTFASPNENKLRLEMLDPQGKAVDLEKIKQEDSFPIGDTISLPVSSYIVQNSVRGFYTLNIYRNGLSAIEVRDLAFSTYPNAVVTVINNDNLEIETHMASYLIDVGDKIGVVSKVVDPATGAVPANFHVTHAMMDVITPDGQDVEIQMQNQVSEFSENPSDYVAVLTADVAGDYLIQARIEGWLEGSTATETVPFVRTTDHIVAVSGAALSIPGTASFRSQDKDHIFVDIDVKLSKDSQPSLRAYAEVWGVDGKSGIPKAACWIGGIAELTRNGAESFVTLELDTKWLQRAGVAGPLTLKNVYVSDMSTSFPVAKAQNEIKLKNSEKIQIQISPELIGMPISREMRVGRNPLPKKNLTKSSAATPTLFLLPGYCASENPWSKSKAHFNDAGFFVEPGSFGHDEYAQKAISYINTHDPSSFSLIGHSQGGFVSLHIANYYFTALENAEGGKLIQTVGTPWEGCSAAGDAASLGKVFGIACGSNSDLTRDGAANWLTGISAEARKDVHFYTTTYAQGGFFGDYCSLPMNMILQWPNDGTTELKYATLKGAQNEGNTEKQCHVPDMKYLCQTEDNNRNAILNANAAR